MEQADKDEQLARELGNIKFPEELKQTTLRHKYKLDEFKSKKEAQTRFGRKNAYFDQRFT